MGLKCKVLKSNVWTGVAVRKSSWSSDGNKVVEFFRILMLLTPLQLVLVLQYLTNPSFMVRSDRSFVVHFVVHLLEPMLVWRFRI